MTFKLGPRLRALRDDAGVTASDLAAALGVGVAELREAESGERVGLNPALCRYADACALLVGGAPDSADAVALRDELYRLSDEDRALWAATPGRKSRPPDDR